MYYVSHVDLNQLTLRYKVEAVKRASLLATGCFPSMDAGMTIEGLSVFRPKWVDLQIRSRRRRGIFRADEARAASLSEAIGEPRATRSARKRTAAFVSGFVKRPAKEEAFQAASSAGDALPSRRPGNVGL